MPRYAPQSLPMGGSRPQAGQPINDTDQNDTSEGNSLHPAVSLGQHIRRERGMDGVRGYVVSIRDYLPSEEYQDLCRSLGVPPDLQAPVNHRQQAAQPQHQETPQPAQNNPNNQMQMMQMLQMLMAMQGGGMGAGGFNPLAQLAGMGGGMPMQGGGQNGLNPMMLAQLLSSMQPK